MYIAVSWRHGKRGSTLGSDFPLYMYRVDKYVRVVICLRREYNKIIIIIITHPTRGFFSISTSNRIDKCMQRSMDGDWSTSHVQQQPFQLALRKVLRTWSGLADFSWIQRLGCRLLQVWDSALQKIGIYNAHAAIMGAPLYHQVFALFPTLSGLTHPKSYCLYLWPSRLHSSHMPNLPFLPLRQRFSSLGEKYDDGRSAKCWSPVLVLAAFIPWPGCQCPWNRHSWESATI